MEKRNEMTIYEKQARERINFLVANFCDGSQQRFSEKTKLNKASVSQYMNGKNVPSNITAAKIAEVFNVNPAWLMGFDVPMQRSAQAQPSSNLRDDEVQLLSYYNLLDTEDKAEVRGYARGLMRSLKYTKDSSVETA